MIQIVLHRGLSLVIAYSDGMQWKRGETSHGWRDKSGSPVEPQAIGMAWVRPCRSVGARAAPDAFANEFNSVFGTVRDFISAEPLP
jgi:hypothetical protein